MKRLIHILAPYLAFLAFMVGLHLFFRHPTVRPGQVWTYTIGDGNPWGESWTKTNVVLEVRDGWVRYKTQSGLGMEYVDSCRVSWFQAGSTLIGKEGDLYLNLRIPDSGGTNHVTGTLTVIEKGRDE